MAIWKDEGYCLRVYIEISGSIISSRIAVASLVSFAPSSPFLFAYRMVSTALEQLSYSVGSSLYFSAKNREASYDNLEGEAFKRTEAKLKPVHGENHRG